LGTKKPKSSKTYVLGKLVHIYCSILLVCEAYSVRKITRIYPEARPNFPALCSYSRHVKDILKGMQLGKQACALKYENDSLLPLKINRKTNK